MFTRFEIPSFSIPGLPAMFLIILPALPNGLIALGRLYARLPRNLKALGDRLGDGSPAGVRAALESAAR